MLRVLQLQVLVHRDAPAHRHLVLVQQRVKFRVKRGLAHSLRYTDVGRGRLTLLKVGLVLFDLASDGLNNIIAQLLAD